MLINQSINPQDKRNYKQLCGREDNIKIDLRINKM